GTALLVPNVTPSQMTVVNLGIGQRLLFGGDDGVHGREPWISDGTTGGTFMLQDVYPGGNGNARDFTAINGIALFRSFFPAGGLTLMRTDGTPGGTTRVMGSAGEQLIGVEYLVVNPTTSVAFFATNTLGGNNTELWRSDGTDAGTTQVLDILPGN